MEKQRKPQKLFANSHYWRREKSTQINIKYLYIDVKIAAVIIS